MNEFKSVEKVIRNIKKYEEEHFGDTMPVVVNKKSKVFYHYTEWSGWRFYLKALKYGDFRSIWHHFRGMHISKLVDKEVKIKNDNPNL